MQLSAMHLVAVAVPLVAITQNKLQNGTNNII